MEYLYHGSSGYYKTLIPHQAHDGGFEEGCRNAIYATTDKNMAWGGTGSKRGDRAVEIQEINVDDYLCLCQVKGN